MDEIYDKLKDAFSNNPILSTMKEDEQIIKNFGYTKFADSDEIDEEELENNNDLGIFEGDPN